MTERESLLKILERMGVSIYANREDCVEFQSSCGYNAIVVEFDAEEKIIDIY